MKGIIYVSNSRFKKFYIRDLFTNELKECSEELFDSIIISFRHLYEMEYQGPNTQIFKGKDNGIVEAKRER